MKKLAFVNTKYGYLVVDKEALLELPRPILRRVFSALLKYVSGNTFSLPYRHLSRLLAALPGLEKTASNKSLQGHECFVFALHEEGKLGISGAAFSMADIKPHPIRVGESLHWDRRWEIQLTSPRRGGTLDRRWETQLTSPQRGGTLEEDSQCYYVRHFINKDTELGRRGVRAVRRYPLPPLHSRRALPVIIDSQGNVVTIPHLKYVDKKYGLVAQVKYKPFLSIETIINQSESIHNY